MPPDLRVAVGVSVAVDYRGQRLMVLRGGNEWYADGPGTWAHPGGWLEYGETPQEAAAREVLEETGVQVCRPRLVDQPFTNFNHGRSLWIVNLFVTCEYESGEATVTEPDKCPEVAWVPIHKVGKLPLFEPTRVLHEILTAA